MRILVVSTRSPYPLIEGRALRTYNLLKETARHHSVYLCTYVQSEAEIAGLDHLREFCATVRSVPLYMAGRALSIAKDVFADAFSSAPVMVLKYDTEKMRAEVVEAIRVFKPDVVHLDMLHLGILLPCLRGLPVVLVEHNVESALLVRRVSNESSYARRLYLGRQARKLRSYEARVCGGVDEIVAVSDVDAEMIRALAPRTPVTVVPNGVDTGYFSPSTAPQNQNSMVYVGGLSWFPNLDAINFYSKEILARIVAEVPGATLTVVGQVPSAKTLDPWRETPGVRFAGLVDDIRPIVREAGVYIVPLRVGGGTRLKILDALAMGKAVVSTSIGCEGLDVQSGRDILIADGAEEFASAVLRVMQDDDLATRLGEAGRRCVERSYQWSAIAQRLEAVYARAAGI